MVSGFVEDRNQCLLHTSTEHIFAITTTSQLPNACDFAGDIQGDILRKIFFVGKDKYSAPGIV